MSDTLEYAELPERAQQSLAEAGQRIAAIIGTGPGEYADVPAPTPNGDGDREEVDGVEFTHRFVHAPGESEQLTWHFVEAGQRDGTPIVFLHGIPDSWYMWHHQIKVLSDIYRCIAVDLKGYGQSDKRTGDYRHEGVAEQMLALLDKIGLERFHVIASDRGSVQADYLGANHPERFLSYIRGEQHLYNFNPVCAPQEAIFRDPETAPLLGRPGEIARILFAALATYPVAEADRRRTVLEFGYEGIGQGVTRYFNSSSFRKEWIDRRSRLMRAWDFPVLILQGYHDPFQPREFYIGTEKYMPNAQVDFVNAGHYYQYENPGETTEKMSAFLAAVDAQISGVMFSS